MSILPFGRKILIALLASAMATKPHLVGTQTLYHSQHLNITESTDIEDYAKAREIAFDEECRGIGMLQAATGKQKMWCSVLPKMVTVNFKGTWIYTPDYQDNWTSNRLRWQFWTFRYES